MSKKESKPDPFAELMSSLSPRAATLATLEPAHPLATVSDTAPSDPENEEFSDFCAGLSPAIQQQIEADVPPPDKVEPDVNAARYCIIEGPDGEFPHLHGYSTPKACAERLRELEGKDTVVHVVYGIPLRITVGPQRYLLLPDGQQAIQVPMIPNGPAKLLDASLIEDMEIQEDGFLGPPELIDTPQEKRKPKNKKKAKRGKDDDDEEEDEEEGEGSDA